MDGVTEVASKMAKGSHEQQVRAFSPTLRHLVFSLSLEATGPHWGLHIGKRA